MKIEDIVKEYKDKAGKKAFKKNGRPYVDFEKWQDENNKFAVAKMEWSDTKEIEVLKEKIAKLEEAVLTLSKDDNKSKNIKRS